MDSNNNEIMHTEGSYIEKFQSNDKKEGISTLVDPDCVDAVFGRVLHEAREFKMAPLKTLQKTAKVCSNDVDYLKSVINNDTLSYDERNELTGQFFTYKLNGIAVYGLFYILGVATVQNGMNKRSIRYNLFHRRRWF